MESPAITAQEDISVSDAAALMLKYDIGGLPIVDKKEKVIGMVTRTDLLKQL